MHLVFQSLSRDSVCLDHNSHIPAIGALTVSIPESGFCLFGLCRSRRSSASIRLVSIPESGFCLFGLKTGVRSALGLTVSIPESGFCLFGLNLSPSMPTCMYRVSIPESGFCLFGLSPVPGRAYQLVGFQSLSRDSVCLDFVRLFRVYLCKFVSIPESGFCLFGLGTGILFQMESSTFQSLSRDSVCLDCRSFSARLCL